MTFDITALYAVPLTAGFLLLANLVSARRAATGISILHGDDIQLALRIRRHGNFAEYVPLALILMALCETRGLSAPWLHAMGAVLVASRLLHALGLDPAKPAAPLRIAGGTGTQAVMLAAAAWLAWSLI